MDTFYFQNFLLRNTLFPSCALLGNILLCWSRYIQGPQIEEPEDGNYFKSEKGWFKDALRRKFVYMQTSMFT